MWVLLLHMAILKVQYWKLYVHKSADTCDAVNFKSAVLKIIWKSKCKYMHFALLLIFQYIDSKMNILMFTFS